MINRFYGVLRGDLRITEDIPGFRFSTTYATDKQSRALRDLIPSDPREACVFIDFILKLLSCSPYWSAMIRDVDMNNTYDVEVLSDDDMVELPFDPMDRLMRWETHTTIEDSRIPYAAGDPTIDRICAKLFAVFLLGGSDDSELNIN